VIANVSLSASFVRVTVFTPPGLVSALVVAACILRIGLEAADEQQRLNRFCEVNVIEQVRNVCHTTIVQGAWRRGQDLAVHGWVYGLTNGLLKNLDVTVTSAAASGYSSGTGGVAAGSSTTKSASLPLSLLGLAFAAVWIDERVLLQRRQLKVGGKLGAAVVVRGRSRQDLGEQYRVLDGVLCAQIALIAAHLEIRVEEGIRRGVLRRGEAWEIALAIAAQTQGMISLYRGGRFDFSEAEFRKLCLRTTKRLFDGLRKQD
jgi:hypothetical protein